MTFLRVSLLLVFAFPANVSLVQANVVPYTSTSVLGWNPDRYMPKIFTYVDGHFNLGISSDDADGNRPAGYESIFFRLQGVFHTADSGGLGWVISTDIRITEEMLTTGLWRTDVWGRTGLNRVDDATSDYTIFGFKRKNSLHLRYR